MGQSDFLDFNFSFRLTFADTTTRNNWYQSVTLTNRKSFHSAFGYLGKLLALNLIGFAAGMCWAGTNNQLDHIFSLGFNVNLSVCKFFLILLGGAPPLDNLQLV